VTRWFLVAAVLVMPACVTTDDAAPPLDSTQIARILPDKVKDRIGWATDIAAAIAATELAPNAERVCAVIAVVDQESGFQADPQVHNLPAIVRESIKQKLSGLGPLAGPAASALLAGNAPGETQTFEQRIAKLRTERDLDLFFRDMAAAYRDKFPGSTLVASGLSRLLGRGSLDDMNPVTTIGSMQVKVAYARTLGELEDLDDATVRDVLYTRAGGLRAGVARLLGYQADYDDIIYRFADYNAGPYASRNAAFQQQLADLTGLKLALDGDLLAYDPDGDPSGDDSKSLQALLIIGRRHDRWDWTIRRAAGEEKSRDFEGTSAWDDVRGDWQQKFKKEPQYARMPVVTLASAKLAKGRTTEWFADNVKKRYHACRARL
jgi:hypothetical protein